MEGVHFVVFAVVVYLVDFAGVVGHFGLFLPGLGVVLPGFFPESSWWVSEGGEGGMGR